MMFGLGRLAAVAATVIGIAAGSANAYAADKDIVDTAVAAGEFKTLAAALTAAGLVDTLKGPGPFTVFAPTDAAFAKLPAGTLDEHDGEIEDPLAAAHRELEEETGFRAGSMERIGGFWSAPGFSTEYLTLYLATDLHAAGDDRLAPDLDEDLCLVVLPLADAVEAVEAGLIEDAKSIAGILQVARRLGAV